MKKYVYGYNDEEAVEEAQRCINCKNATMCSGMSGVNRYPVHLSNKIKEGEFEEAYQGISANLPRFLAVCGRVCPQESQCEGQCIRGIKGEAGFHR